MGVGFFGRFFSKGKISPDIKSVKPNLTKTVKQTKQDEFRKRYTALDKAQSKIQSGKKLIKEGQKERTKMVDTNRAFQFKGGSYHAIQPGKDPKKEYKGLLKEKKAKGGRVGLKLGTKRKSNVDKIKKTFGTLSVRAGRDNNPNPTYADKIAGAKMKNKNKKKVI